MVEVRPPMFIRVARNIRHSKLLRSADALWDVIRPLYKSMLGLFRRGVSVEVEGLGRILLHPAFMNEEIDPLELSMLRKFYSVLEKDSCLFDVGASIGLHSMIAGNVLGDGASLHAFEPDLPSCQRFWTHTEIMRSSLPVSLMRCFLSDECNMEANEQAFQDLQFEHLQKHFSDAELGSSTKHLYLDKRSDAEQEIPQLTLDAYVEVFSCKPDIVKCDIEGAELLFLKGAEQTLRTYKPKLFISLHPELISNFAYDEEAFYEFLRKLGYKWEILNEVGETHLFAR